MQKDVQIGDAGQASLIQANGKLTVKADVSQPISVGGDPLGKIDGSVSVELDEVAVLKHFAAKYSSNPIVAEGIALITGALAAIP